MPYLADLRDCLEDAAELARQVEAAEKRAGHGSEEMAAFVLHNDLRNAANLARQAVAAARAARAKERPPGFAQRIRAALAVLVGRR